MMQNLLAQAQAGGGEPAGGESVVVRFKAGKCETEPRPNGKLWIKPINRKGEVQLIRQDDLLHFQWRDRTTLAVDPSCDHMIFPGDAKFEKIDTGNESDRCFVLQFQAQANRRFFFWLQSKEDADDEAKVKTLNDTMNGVSFTQNESTPDLSTPQVTGETINPGQLTLEGLQSVMQNLGMPPAPTSPAPPLRLSDVADADAILASGLLQESAVVDRLLPYLPEGQRTPAELEAVLRSPQFRQSLDQLGHALASPENFGSILANFRLAPDPHAQPLDPVRSFLDALMHTASTSSATPDQDDEEMLDAPPHPPSSSSPEDD